MRWRHLAILCTLTWVLGPSSARAEGLFTPFLGTSSQGDASENNNTLSASLGATAGGVLGFEVDFARTSGFFGDSDLVGDNNVTTVAANLVLGVPLGAVRPYASGGLGLLRSTFNGSSNGGDATTNDLGVNIGGGLMGFFTDHVGARGDVRYFRNVSNEGNPLDFELGSFDFWRVVFGVVLRF